MKMKIIKNLQKEKKISNHNKIMMPNRNNK